MTDEQTKPRPRARRPKIGPLARFIRKHYGSNRALAQALDVTPQTVSNYLTRDPLQVLKHLDRMSADLELPAGRITRAALGQQKYIQQNHEGNQ